MKKLKLSGNARIIRLDADGQSIPETVEDAIESSEGGKPRIDALKSVKWVLRSGSMWVGPVDPVTLDSTLVDSVKDALVFDGRDNEQTRAAFFSRHFEAPFTSELLRVL